MLQKKLPDYVVKNYGVSGYSVANVFALYNKKLELNKGDIVIYAYLSEHENRYRKSVLKAIHDSPFQMKNYIVLDENLNIKCLQNNYKLNPLCRYFVSINLLDDIYNEHTDNQKKAHKIAIEAIEKLNSLCNQHECTFILCGIESDSQTKLTIRELSNKNVQAFDISVDLGNNKYRLIDDDHPNANANKVFASKIYSILEGFL